MERKTFIKISETIKKYVEMKSICINEKYYKKYFEGRVEGGRFAPVTAADLHALRANMG